MVVRFLLISTGRPFGSGILLTGSSTAGPHQNSWRSSRRSRQRSDPSLRPDPVAPPRARPGALSRSSEPRAVAGRSLRPIWSRRSCSREGRRTTGADAAIKTAPRARYGLEATTEGQRGRIVGRRAAVRTKRVDRALQPEGVQGEQLGHLQHFTARGRDDTEQEMFSSTSFVAHGRSRPECHIQGQPRAGVQQKPLTGETLRIGADVDLRRSAHLRPLKARFCPGPGNHEVPRPRLSLGEVGNHPVGDHDQPIGCHRKHRVRCSGGGPYDRVVQQIGVYVGGNP